MRLTASLVHVGQPEWSSPSSQELGRVSSWNYPTEDPNPISDLESLWTLTKFVEVFFLPKLCLLGGGANQLVQLLLSLNCSLEILKRSI